MADKHKESRRAKEREEREKQYNLKREEHEKQLKTLRVITDSASLNKQEEAGKAMLAVEEIEKLHKLMKDGILSQQEFDSAKNDT